MVAGGDSDDAAVDVGVDMGFASVVKRRVKFWSRDAMLCSVLSRFALPCPASSLFCRQRDSRSMPETAVSACAAFAIARQDTHGYCCMQETRDKRQVTD